MAFMISKSHKSSSQQAEEANLSEDTDKGQAMNSVTSHLSLVSSPSSSQPSQPLDREAVLRRIRHHKRLNKLKSTFESMVRRTGQEDRAAVAVADREKWVELDDIFSSP